MLAEAIAIAAGILGAFGVDALWQGRMEQREVREALAALRVEFELHRSEVERVRDRLQRTESAIEGALQMDAAEVRSLSADSADVLIGLLYYHNRPYLTDAALQALLSADVLQKIPSQELRGAIAAWPGLVTVPVVQYEEVEETGLIARARLRELGIYDEWVLCFGDLAPCNQVGYLELMVTDPEYRQILGHRYIAVSSMQNQMAWLAEHVELVLSLIPA